jgi:hypothetical protein
MAGSQRPLRLVLVEDYAQGFHIGRPRPMDDLLVPLSFA